MSDTAPSYIPADVVGAPLEFAWEGSRAHRGDGHVMNKSLDALTSTTTTGQYVLLAGVVEWALWRLEGHTDTTQARHFRDALFAYQVDIRYADRKAGAWDGEPEADPAAAALYSICRFAFRAMNPKWQTSYFQPIPETYHASKLLRHTLPKKRNRAFGAWIRDAASRVRELAPKPEEEQRRKADFDSEDEHAAYLARHWGPALPLELLERSVEPAESARTHPRTPRVALVGDQPLPSGSRRIALRDRPKRSP